MCAARPRFRLMAEGNPVVLLQVVRCKW